MKNKLVKSMSLALAGSMLVTSVALADREVKKNETIYVTKEANEILNKTASIWINSDGSIKVKDKSDLKDIKNLKTDEAVKTKDGNIDWNTEDKDVFYQGETDKDLPVDISVKYFLDGKEISSKDLEGKSGHLKVEISAVNKTSGLVNINGENKKIFSPYLVLSEINFDSDRVTNITSSDGKIIKDGKNEIVASVLSPGLRENFEGLIDEDKLDKFKDKVTMEMDVKDYKPTEVYAVITNELFQDSAKLNSLDDLRKGIDDLEDNAGKLVYASNQLGDVGKKLNDGIGQLSNGALELQDGSAKIVSSFDQLALAFQDLPDKVGQMTTAIDMLSEGGSRLNTGVNQYTGAVNQINASMPKLTGAGASLESGASELDSGLYRLEQATSTLREKVGMASGENDLSKLTESLGSLKTGLDDLSNGMVPLKQGVDDLNLGLGQIEKSSQDLSAGVSNLIDLSQNTPSMNESGANIEAQAAAIDGVIAELSQNNEEGINDGQIQSLEAIKNSLYAESQTLYAAANSQDALTGGLGEISTGALGLSSAISNASAGASEISGQLSASSEKVSQASAGLSQGIDKISQGFNNSDLGKLGETITMLDEATGKLKAGSSKLKEGASQNRAGVDQLAQAIAELDGNSSSLQEGSNELYNGLLQFQERSKALSSLGDINEKAINPMANGLRQLDAGINKLGSATGELKNGSDQYMASFDEFRNGLSKYKSEGIDELYNKTGDIDEVSEILDQMAKLAKENKSLTGTSDSFETRSRIIEKIK